MHVPDEQKDDLDALRAAVKKSRHTYGDVAWPIHKSAGWIGEVLRGNYPFYGGCQLPKNIGVRLQDLGFEIPDSLKCGWE